MSLTIKNIIHTISVNQYVGDTINANANLGGNIYTIKPSISNSTVTLAGSTTSIYEIDSKTQDILGNNFPLTLNQPINFNFSFLNSRYDNTTVGNSNMFNFMNGLSNSLGFQIPQSRVNNTSYKTTNYDVGTFNMILVVNNPTKYHLPLAININSQKFDNHFIVNAYNSSLKVNNSIPNYRLTKVIVNPDTPSSDAVVIDSVLPVNITNYVFQGLGIWSYDIFVPPSDNDTYIYIHNSNPILTYNDDLIKLVINISKGSSKYQSNEINMLDADTVASKQIFNKYMNQRGNEYIIESSFKSLTTPPTPTSGIPIYTDLLAENIPNLSNLWVSIWGEGNLASDITNMFNDVYVGKSFYGKHTVSTLGDIIVKTLNPNRDDQFAQLVANFENVVREYIFMLIFGSHNDNAFKYNNVEQIKSGAYLLYNFATYYYQKINKGTFNSRFDFQLVSNIFYYYNQYLNTIKTDVLSLPSLGS